MKFWKMTVDYIKLNQAEVPTEAAESDLVWLLEKTDDACGVL